MRQAIATKFIGPTNHRGARVKAYCQAGEFTMPWDYALGVEDNHRKAATFLLDRLGWDGNYHGGAMWHITGYVFIACPHNCSDASDHVYGTIGGCDASTAGRT
jgi:hypothetical protein